MWWVSWVRDWLDLDVLILSRRQQWRALGLFGPLDKQTSDKWWWPSKTFLPRSGGGDDHALWHHSPTEFHNYFSASKTCKQLWTRQSKKNWSRVVWFSQGVSRFALITWLAVKDRFYMGVKMRRWVATCMFIAWRVGGDAWSPIFCLSLCFYGMNGYCWRFSWYLRRLGLDGHPASPHNPPFPRDNYLLIWLVFQAIIY